MKAIIILCLFCLSALGADITTTNIVDDITTKVSEQTGADGKPVVRIETICRGKLKVLQIVSRKNKHGELATVSRAYFVNGKLEMVESDNNRDGVLESVAVFSPKNGDFEMFRRQPDGTVRPLSTKELTTIKQKKELADDALDKFIMDSSKK